MAGLAVVTCVAVLAILLISHRGRRERSRIRCGEHEGSIVGIGTIPESDPCRHARGKDGVLVRWDGASEDSWLVAWTLGDDASCNPSDLRIGDPEVRSYVKDCCEKYTNALNGVRKCRRK